MTAQNADESTAQTLSDEEATLKRVEALATLLDARFELFGVRFGLDALIGLIPGVGDAATGLLSTYIIIEAARAGASPIILLQMVFNVLIDFIVGAVPVIGDIFDVAFRANVKNAELLKRHLEKRMGANGPLPQ